MIKKFLLSALLIISYMNGSNAQYCMPDYVFGCFLGDDINTFLVTGANSTAITTNNSGCSSSNDYEDFTTSIVDFDLGGTYTATINSEAANDFVEVYIDFDNDQAFSSAESVGGTNNVAVAPATSTFSINIPVGSTPGTYRMRVVLSGDSTYPGINPCPWNLGMTGYGGGEIHDYTAVITSTSACDTPMNPVVNSLTFNSATISWLAVNGALGYEYVLDQNPGNPTSGTVITDTFYNTSGLTSYTTYYFHVRTNCANNNSAWITIQFQTQNCPQASQVYGTQTGPNSATITWLNVPGVIGYQYSISHLMSSNCGTATIYNTTNNSGLVTGVPPGVHWVCARTICGIGDTSSFWFTQPFTTYTQPGNVGYVSENIFEVSPNPVKNILSIQRHSRLSGTLELIDVTGRLVSRYSFEDAQLSVDMSGLTTGVYFIRYADKEHRQVVKICKE